jgi:hypothetical protein
MLYKESSRAHTMHSACVYIDLRHQVFVAPPQFYLHRKRQACEVEECADKTCNLMFVVHIEYVLQTCYCFTFLCQCITIFLYAFCVLCLIPNIKCKVSIRARVLPCETLCYVKFKRLQKFESQNIYLFF